MLSITELDLDLMICASVHEFRLKYFNDSLGFAEHKQTAIDLLQVTTEILDEFNIDYFLKLWFIFQATDTNYVLKNII